MCFRGGGGGNVHWIGSLLTYDYVTNLLDVQLVAKSVCVCVVYFGVQKVVKMTYPYKQADYVKHEKSETRATHMNGN